MIKDRENLKKKKLETLYPRTKLNIWIIKL